jgi:hypothetical protein
LVIDFVGPLREYSHMSDKSDSEQIDDIIAQQSGWKRDLLIALRGAIRAADPAAIEVVKYKKPSKPEGVPFWTHDGDVCYVEVLKSAVRLTFAKGARMQTSDLFNARLDSKVVRPSTTPREAVWTKRRSRRSSHRLWNSMSPPSDSIECEPTRSR